MKTENDGAGARKPKGVRRMAEEARMKAVNKAFAERGEVGSVPCTQNESDCTQVCPVGQGEPPTCKCGHARNDHEIEPPYYCNGWSMGDGGCECDGYTIPTREAQPEAGAVTGSDTPATSTLLRVLMEETVLAGFPAGDREQTLANVRKMRKELEDCRAQHDCASVAPSVEELEEAARRVITFLKPKFVKEPIFTVDEKLLALMVADVLRAALERKQSQ